MLTILLALAATTPAAVEPAKLDKKHPDYVRCKTERMTGTLGAKPLKTCRTNAQWEAMSRDGKEATEKWQRAGTGRAGN